MPARKAAAVSEYKPNYSKIIESLVLLSHIKQNLDHYQAVKLLYLADKEHLNRHGRPITYDDYFALPYGPVPSNALNLLTLERGTLQRFKLNAGNFPIRIEKIKTEKDSTIFVLREPLRPVDYDEFSDSDVELLNWAVENYGNKSFSELYDITHKHFAYKFAWDNKEKDKKRAGMKYVDMFEEGERKSHYISDKLPFAAHSRCCLLYTSDAADE